MHQRLIVVANRTCPCPALVDEVTSRVHRETGRVHVVAPALNTRVRHWLSDTDAATEQAAGRMREAVTSFRAAGLTADGSVGDADPLLAIEDLLAEFDGDAVLISTWPEGSSNWLERDLLTRARQRLSLPVHHVVSRYDVPVAA